MEKTFRSKLNKEWKRRCGIIFITFVLQIKNCVGLPIQNTCPDTHMYNSDSSEDYHYDPYREICCEGKIFDNSFQQYGCHRSSNGDEEIFLAHEEFFCGDVKLKIQGERLCCGSTVYNATVFSCCEGHLVPKQANMECCGTVLINPNETTCCYGNQVDGIGECCGSSQLYNNTQVCIGGSVYQIPSGGDPYSSYGICDGGQLYDKEKQICCGGNVSEKRGNMKCTRGILHDTAEKASSVVQPFVRDIVGGKTKPCGNQMYNPNREVCCLSRNSRYVTDVGSANGACCDGVAYSKDSDSCCNGVITQGIPEIPGIQACSLTVSYLTSANISCSEGSSSARYSNDKVECCSGEIYFLEQSVCCMGVIRNKTGTGVCCGTSVLDSNEHCVNDKKIQAKEGDDKLCIQYDTNYGVYQRVPSRVIPYNSTLHICKNGALVLKKPKMAYCEGSGQIYDTETEICCGNFKVFPKESEWGWRRRCCGYESYHPGVQSCYHTHVYHFPEKFSRRCHLTLYDSRTHVCIDDHIFNKTVTHLTPEICEGVYYLRAFNQTCCAGKPIDDATHLCCNNRIYPKEDMEDASSQYICCDGRVHGTGGVDKTCVGRLAVADYEQVCGDMVYNRTDGECCGSGLYNPDTHLCCDNVRIEKESQNDICCGTTKYDPAESKTCCDSALYDNANGFKCCGSSLINPSHDICIDDQYVISRQFEEFTCDSSVTDDPTGTCCAGIKHVQKFGSCDGIYVNEGDDTQDSESPEADEDTLSRCGDEEYSEATHTCCSGKVIKNSNKICCDGRIRKVTDLGENSCCGRNAYNNESSICCGNQVRVRSEIQDEEEAEECCEEEKYFNLDSGQCEERVEGEEEQEVCSLCQDSRYGRREISRLIRNAVHHLRIKVSRTLPNKNSLIAKVWLLSKDCSPSLNKKEMKKLKRLILPEGCNCEIETGRYVLLSSGELDGEGGLVLWNSDVLLPPRAASTVTDVLQTNCTTD